MLASSVPAASGISLLCRQASHFAAAFAFHLGRVHKPKPYKCPVCDAESS
jgi:hypothetical protein